MKWSKHRKVYLIKPMGCTTIVAHRIRCIYLPNKLSLLLHNSRIYSSSFTGGEAKNSKSAHLTVSSRDIRSYGFLCRCRCHCYIIVVSNTEATSIPSKSSESALWLYPMQREIRVPYGGATHTHRPVHIAWVSHFLDYPLFSRLLLE